MYVSGQPFVWEPPLNNLPQIDSRVMIDWSEYAFITLRDRMLTVIRDIGGDKPQLSTSERNERS